MFPQYNFKDVIDFFVAVKCKIGLHSFSDPISSILLISGDWDKAGVSMRMTKGQWTNDPGREFNFSELVRYCACGKVVNVDSSQG